MSNPTHTLHAELFPHLDATPDAPRPGVQYSAPIGPLPLNIAEEIVQFMERFVSFPDPAQADSLALWILHTHTFDAAYATPYMYVTSAEKQSGKTRVIEVLSTLARHATVTASTSSAAMFRLISEDRPTLFIDEVDAVFNGAANEDLRGVLNSGYKRNGSVLRFTGKETESFSTFCPKLLAGIDNASMPDTIADRCIRIVLKRKRAGDDVERFMWRKVEAEAETLQARITTWARKNLESLYAAEPTMIEEISDRSFEIAEPLLAIADRLPDWHERARRSLTSLLRGEVKALSPQAQALQAAQDWMSEAQADRIPSAVLADLVGVNMHRLGKLLAPYEVKPTTARVAGKPTKVYMQKDFEDAWGRYL